MPVRRAVDANVEMSLVFPSINLIFPFLLIVIIFVLILRLNMELLGRSLPRSALRPT